MLRWVSLTDILSRRKAKKDLKREEDEIAQSQERFRSRHQHEIFSNLGVRFMMKDEDRSLLVDGLFIWRFDEWG